MIGGEPTACYVGMTKSIKVHTRRRTATAPPVLLHCAAATEET